MEGSGLERDPGPAGDLQVHEPKAQRGDLLSIKEMLQKVVKMHEN